MHRRPPTTAWTVSPGPVPVAVAALDPDWPDEHDEMLHTLSGSFGFGFGQVQQVWRACHLGTDVAGYVVGMRPVTLPAGRTEPITASELRWRDAAPGGRVAHVVLEIDCAALAAVTDDEVAAGRTAMARAVRGMLALARVSDDAADEVLDAWLTAPATFALNIVTTPTVSNDLPPPISLDAALVSEMDRRVAQAVHAAGVVPGRYTDEAAKQLDRDVLAPAALNVLTQRLSVHGMDDVVRFGMWQLQCAVVHNRRRLGDTRRAALHLSVDWDPADVFAQEQREHLALRRSVESVVEAALRAAPTGTVPVDAVAWGEILAAAFAYLNATSRSEAIHHQVAPQALRISESFEIDIVALDSEAARGDGRRSYDLDVAAFTRARALFEMTEAISDTDETQSDRTGYEPGALAPQRLETAMATGFGVTLTDLYTVLIGLVAWPVEAGGPGHAVSTRDDVVAHVLDATVMGEQTHGAARVEAALDMLVSTSRDMQAADWKPWHVRARHRRLLVRPLPVLSDQRLVIAPHFCRASLEVYNNHIGQGQLPWSQPPAPLAVERALEAVRDERNKALERQVAELLRAQGFTVIDGVKETKPQRLGLDHLSTEIDVVAGRPDSHVLWLLEVKDPVDSYAIPEIRRHLDRFFASSKKPSYIEQFRRKVADLAPHADAVAHALGLPPCDGQHPYSVQALFVTRRPVPAAFVTSDAEFVSLYELLTRIALPEDQDADDTDEGLR